MTGRLAGSPRIGKTGVVAAATAVISAALAVIGAARAVEPSGPPPAMGGWRAVTMASGIDHPWGLTWLLDGRPLVTSKNGTLHVLDNGTFHQIPIEGLPPVFTGGQGGLMDIALHPEYRDNGYVYMTMSTGDRESNRTILVRGVFDGQRVKDVKTLFQASPTKSGGQHFGSRLLWLPDGTLLMSVGDGGNPPTQVDGILARENGQRLDRHLGKVLRLTEDGRPARGNPFTNRADAKPEVYSYGHRNIQGLALDPLGRVWANEHGPRGGDELNVIRAGANYGWPRATFGRDYRTGEPIGRTSVPGMVDPKVAWVPAHAPSGLVFYSGDKAPAWRGDLFSGGLASQDIRRIRLDANGSVAGQDRLETGVRIRDVRQGPDGFIYALTDERNGRLLRIEPTG